MAYRGEVSSRVGRGQSINCRCHYKPLQVRLYRGSQSCLHGNSRRRRSRGAYWRSSMNGRHNRTRTELGRLPVGSPSSISTKWVKWVHRGLLSATRPHHSANSSYSSPRSINRPIAILKIPASLGQTTLTDLAACGSVSGSQANGSRMPRAARMAAERQRLNGDPRPGGCVEKCETVLASGQMPG